MESLLFFAVVVLGVLVGILWERVERLRDQVRSLARERRRELDPAEPTAPRELPATATPRVPDPRPVHPLATVAADESVELDASEIEVVREAPTELPDSRGIAASRDLDEPTARREAVAAVKGESDFSFEEILAGKWLTWVGAVAVVLGAGFFFKYAIDAGWIGPAERVLIGLVVGVGAYVGGIVAAKRDFGWLGQGLVGAAAGVLYFDLYAAIHFYDLVSVPLAFGGMVAVTAATLAFSAWFRAEATAVLGLLGGFLTPLLLDVGLDRPESFFSYLLMLDLGVFALAILHRWRILQNTAFCGTVLMWMIWFATQYQPAMLVGTIILLSVFFVLLMTIGLWRSLARHETSTGDDVGLLLGTPLLYFAALYGLTFEDHSAWHGAIAAMLAVVHLAVGWFVRTRNADDRVALTSVLGLGIGFLVLAVPLQLTGHWIVACWAVLALILVEVGLRANLVRLRLAGFGLLVAVGGILVLYAARGFDDPHLVRTLVFRMEGVVTVGETAAWNGILNGRSLAFLVSAAVLGVLAWEYGHREPRQTELYGDLTLEQISGTMTALAGGTLMTLAMVETFAVGRFHGWHDLTIVAACSAWSTLTAIALVQLSTLPGPKWLARIGLAALGLTALFLVGESLVTFGNWPAEWQRIRSSESGPGWWGTFLVNPRGLAMAFAVLGSAAASFLVWPGERERKTGEQRPVHVLFALGAYLIGLQLVTTEVYALGVERDWRTWTSLAITGAWTLYAAGTLVAGIVLRSGSVRGIGLALLLVTTGKVFLYDVWYVDRGIRTLAFTGLGVALLLVSWAYRRHRDRIRSWIGVEEREQNTSGDST